MTWRNPQLSQAAQQWRLAQNELFQVQRKIRVRDEESSSAVPERASTPSLRSAEMLADEANRALALCLRIARQADAPR